MAGENVKNSKFGTIAVEMHFVDQGKVDKALVVQTRIFNKTRVTMPIGEILVEMGAITPAERDQILQVQQELDSRTHSTEASAKPEKQSKSLRSVKKEDTAFDITVSKDKLTASIYIDGTVPTTALDVNDVKTRLHSQGILHGIVEDVHIQEFLNAEFSVGEQWAIAAGTDPIPDAPPQIRYLFDTDPLKIGTLTEDGLMDWKERGDLPQVKAGDLLAEKIPGPKGREGMDVFGSIIPIPRLREQRFKCGKGARRSEDGMQVHATLSGIPKLSVTGEISVMPTLHIQGDIALQTGHVVFDGHIEVAGAVEKGYRVKGGSLRAKEIRDARIDVDGDISAANGIFGATIRSGGNLKAGHIHNCDIIITGDMAVEKEIIESRIEVNGRCLVNDGIIISSTISAKMGITAMDVGTQASKSNEMVVGIDQHMQREAEAIKAEIKAIKAERENLPKLLQNLKSRSDQVNTRLGAVAQEQDKCMVQHRRLQEKVEAGLLKKDNAAAEKLQKTIVELKAKQDAYDQDVAQLMEADESISQEIAATETAIAETVQTINALDARLNEINEAQKTSHGVAVVKIGGNIIAGTKVSGPHCALVLQEDLKRLSLMETDKPDHEGLKRWRFELNPFR
ncbi:flagellar assembly protein A [Desulfosarcina sp.]|uniref:flagellar assembly protein A n=1 Tax=Desulfosarcina sp. TaxID=2027861 RepID=UPI003970D94E